ncbi:MAG: amidohydrolase family protein [Elusimicrobia bacterium]|nr:amidohydrolase family protein [Elusimicrobiota bacterium]
MVIDSHVHIGGMQTSKTGCFMSPAQQKYLHKEMPKAMSWGFRVAGWLGVVDQKIRERLLKFINEARAVDYAVVFAMDGVYNQSGQLDLNKTSLYTPNDYVLALAQESPKIIPAVSVNPNRRDWRHQLDRCLAQGARAVKWLPSSQHFDPADGKYVDFYKILANKKIPLISHTGFEHTIISVTAQTQGFGEPKRLIPALDQGVAVIMAHSGTSGGPGEPDYWEDFIELCRRYPHLYGDTAAFTHWTRVGLLPKIIHHDWIFERLIHGSDSTLQPSLNAMRNLVSEDLIEELRPSSNSLIKDFHLKKALKFPDRIFNQSAALFNLSPNGAPTNYPNKVRLGVIPKPLS